MLDKTQLRRGVLANRSQPQHQISRWKPGSEAAGRKHHENREAWSSCRLDMQFNLSIPRRDPQRRALRCVHLDDTYALAPHCARRGLGRNRVRVGNCAADAKDGSANRHSAAVPLPRHNATFYDIYISLWDDFPSSLQRFPRDLRPALLSCSRLRSNEMASSFLLSFALPPLGRVVAVVESGSAGTSVRRRSDVPLQAHADYNLSHYRYSSTYRTPSHPRTTARLKRAPD
jgi:hypothetical protein